MRRMEVTMVRSGQAVWVMSCVSTSTGSSDPLLHAVFGRRRDAHWGSRTLAGGRDATTTGSFRRWLPPTRAVAATSLSAICP